MRVEIRDPEHPDGNRAHELVLTYYVSPDGKTSNSYIVALTDDDLDHLEAAVTQRQVDSLRKRAA